MAEYKLVVLSNAVAEQDAEFNDWYDNRHLDDVLNVPGFHHARRFAVERPLSGEEPDHRYLSIYEFASDDLDATISEFLSRTNTDKMPISPALAPDAVPIIYHALGPVRARKDAEQPTS